ncbi:MAG: biopolymer transporter ExbD [Acidobacteriota bacterium]
MQSHVRAEINVTPLVDVCLVLLIIFMVVTPILETRGVQVPEAPSPEQWPAEPSRSKVMLAYGVPPRISLDNDPGPLSEAAFAEILNALHAQNPRREIVLRADRRLPYGAVKRVLRTVQDAGFPTIGLAAVTSARSGAEGRP